VSPELDLRMPRRVHVIGIGGAGMSAIASVLARMGHRVSGSDLRESRGLERLRLLGVDARSPHDPANLPDDVDVVVVSTAIPEHNVEVAAARTRGVPVLRRSEALRALVATRRTIAVAGSHGKTTTSSMLAVILRAAGWHPSFLIGGELNEVGTNAAYDDGEWLVVEADESDGTFLELPSEAGIVTNIEADHLDHYGGFDQLVEAFGRFLDELSGPKVVCIDDSVTRRLVDGRHDVVTYGESPDAGYRLVDYRGRRAGSRFGIQTADGELGAVDLPLAGRYNALNALGASAVALELGVPFEAIELGLSNFGGVARRFQFRGEVDGVTYVDDYAHLPGEVSAAIGAAREGGWRRIIAVFQPHRYTRTARLWREFADAFVDADVVVLTDVYSAGEAPRPGVSGQLVLHAVLDAHPAQAVTYLPHRADLERHVPRLVRGGDVVLTLGAGDLTSLPDVWIERAGAIRGNGAPR